MMEPTEAELAATLETMLRWHRLRYYHTHDSRRSPEGFPDYLVPLPGILLAAELKRDRGRLEAAQIAWLEALAASRALAVLAAGQRGLTVLMALLEKPERAAAIAATLSEPLHIGGPVRLAADAVQPSWLRPGVGRL